MKILAEISEESLGVGEGVQLGQEYQLRKSARAILLNSEGEMATQYLETFTFHKLPGGGVDQGETVEEALKREVLEEVGCDCKITDTVGVVIEYRNKYNLLHISYCYVAEVVGEIGESSLEEKEIAEGQSTVWLKPSEVLEKMKADEPKKFEGLFIQQREISFMEEYLRSK